MKPYFICFSMYLVFWFVLNFLIVPFTLRTKKRLDRNMTKWAKAIVDEMESRK